LLRVRFLPLAPAVKVDERLHTTPFHNFALEPHKVDGLLRRVSTFPVVINNG
jgi:hypothetical protein